jgi:hypothetical protein
MRLTKAERAVLERAKRVRDAHGCEIQLGAAAGYEAAVRLEEKGLGRIEDAPGGYPRFHVSTDGLAAIA